MQGSPDSYRQYLSMRSIGQLAMLVCALMGASAHAQVMRPAGTFPHAHKHNHPSAAAQSTVTPPPPPAAKTPWSANAGAPAPASAPTSTVAPASGAASSNLPPSLLDQPAQPAKIEFSNGKLAVEAQNSSLSAVLHQISADTGMKIDGLAADQRIFGTYGPGAPRQVLLSLLEGSGYNVVMVGGAANEAPLRLELSSPNQTAATPVTNAPTQAAEASDQAASSPPPPAPSNRQPAPNGVMTSQQILKQLQQLHQRQEEPQQPQDQQPQ